MNAKYRLFQVTVSWIVSLCSDGHSTGELVLNSLDTDSPIILGDDFNAGDIDWESKLVKPGSDRKHLCERLIDTLDERHIEQLQREPTRQCALLDLYCTNRPGLVTSIDTVPGISDHDIVVVNTKIKARLTKKPRRPVKQWSKADWDIIRKETTTFRGKFLSEYQERDEDTNYSDFQQHVDDMLDKHVPAKLSSSRKNVPWLTPTIRLMCRKKQRLYKREESQKEQILVLGTMPCASNQYRQCTKESQVGLHKWHPT